MIGYLPSEGFVDSLDQIAMMLICLEESLADVRLTHQAALIPTRRILTSGCGSSISFEPGTNVQPLSSNWRVSPAQILSSLRLLQRRPKAKREMAAYAGEFMSQH